LNARRAPLPFEFARSSALNAGRSLVHRWLAAAERDLPPDFADASIVAEAVVLPPVDAFAATFVSGCSNGADLTLDFVTARGQLVVGYRDDPSGGRLTGARFSPAAAHADLSGVDAWTHNRVHAFAHRWLWAWEQTTQDDRFAGLIDPAGRDAALEELLHAHDGYRATHHALQSLSFALRAERYEVSAVVDWRGESAGGTPLRARTQQRLTLHERGGRYPLLERLAIDVLHPLEPDLPEPDEHPELASAPSDDAESGGA